MNVTLRRGVMQIQDFLAWEARKELKHEFDGLEPVAMAGGTANHAAIQRNLAIVIGGRLLGTGCAFYGSDMKVVTSDRVRYPDGQVVCGGLPGKATFTTGPVVLFEVLSDGSLSTDTVDKVHEYRQIASVRRYVVLNQAQLAATVHERGAEGWTTYPLGAGSTLAMPEIGFELPLAELYRDVEFT